MIDVFNEKIIINHKIIYIHFRELAELSQHCIDLLLKVCFAVLKTHQCYISLFTLAMRDYNKLISIIHFYYGLMIKVYVIYYAEKCIFAYSDDNI